MRRNHTIAAAAAALTVLSACPKPAAQSQGSGPAVATFAGGQITADQLKAKLAELPPPVQARYAPVERRKEFLENMLRTEILVAEARSRNLEKDPEVRATVDRVLAQRVLKLEMEEFEKKNAVSEEELKSFYEAHKTEFLRPERIRVSHVFFSAKPGTARERLKAEAEKTLAEVKLKETGATKTAFAALARSRSDDDASKTLEGDLGFHTKDELAGLWGQPLADAAFSLKSVNEVSGVIPTDKGFHLVKLTGRQPGFDQPFETAKSRIQGRLLVDKRREFTDKLLADLKLKHNVVVHDDVLKSIELPAGSSAPSAAPSMGPAGLPPSAPPAPALPPGHP